MQKSTLLSLFLLLSAYALPLVAGDPAPTAKAQEPFLPKFRALLAAKVGAPNRYSRLVALRDLVTFYRDSGMNLKDFIVAQSYERLVAIAPDKHGKTIFELHDIFDVAVELGIVPVHMHLALMALITMDELEAGIAEIERIQEDFASLPNIDNPNFYQFIFQLLDGKSRRRVRALVKKHASYGNELKHVIFGGIQKVSDEFTENKRQMQLKLESAKETLNLHIKHLWYDAVSCAVQADQPFRGTFGWAAKQIVTSQEAYVGFVQALKRLGISFSALNGVKEENTSAIDSIATSLYKNRVKLAPVGQVLTKYYGRLLTDLEHAITQELTQFKEEVEQEGKPRERGPKKNKKTNGRGTPSPTQSSSSSSELHAGRVSPELARLMRDVSLASSRPATPQELADPSFIRIPTPEELRAERHSITSVTGKEVTIKHRYESIEYTVSLQNIFERTQDVQPVMIAADKVWHGERIECARSYGGDEAFKQSDYYHQFSHNVDAFLHLGERREIDKNGEKQVMVSIFGTIEYEFSGKKIKDLGVFQFTFNTKGVCYHRFFKAMGRTINGENDGWFPRRSFISEQMVSKATSHLRNSPDFAKVLSSRSIAP